VLIALHGEIDGLLDMRGLKREKEDAKSDGKQVYTCKVLIHLS
jgi:hypothetical protein